MPPTETHTDPIKYEFLETKLKEEDNHDPSREDVMRILNLRYDQAGHYLREFKEKNPVWRW